MLVAQHRVGEHFETDEKRSISDTIATRLISSPPRVHFCSILRFSAYVERQKRRNEGCFPLISSLATKSMENNLHFAETLGLYFFPRP